MISLKNYNNKELKNSNFSYSEKTKDEFNAELMKGMEDIEAGRTFSADEVEQEIRNVMKKEGD